MKKTASWWLWLQRNRLPLMILLASVTLILGVIGFGKQSSDSNFFDNLYLSLQLFVLQSGAGLPNMHWTLQVARFSGVIFTFLAAVQILVSTFYVRFELLKIKWTYRNHIIICGLGGLGPILAKHYLDDGEKVVAIEIMPDNKFVESIKEQDGIVLFGDGADPELLKKAGIERARLVVAVCGSDGKNAEIVGQVAKIAEEEKLSDLSCYAHILNPHLSHYLAGQAITSYTNENFQVEFFNIFDSGARLILQEDAMKLSFSGDDRPHMAVIGLNAVGQSLVMRAERAARTAAMKGRRPRLTVIDPRAEEILKLLECSCASLKRTFKLKAYEDNILNASFINTWLGETLNSRMPLTQIYICLEDDSVGLTLGLILQEKLRDQNPAVPILVCMLDHGGLEDVLESREGGRPAVSLLAFDLLEKTCASSISTQGLFEDLAIAVHENYRQAHLKKGGSVDGHSALLPWFSDKDYSALSEEYKEQNRRQARCFGESLWRIGYGIEPTGSQPTELFSFPEDEDMKQNRAILLKELGQRTSEETDDAYTKRLINLSQTTERQAIDLEGKTIQEDDLEYLARQEHESWRQQKLRDGWVYAEKKDNAAKTSPNVLPWYDPRLPDANTRQWTRESVKIWPRLLAELGLRIYRR